MQEKAFFTKKLLKWSTAIDRPMPWKGEKNPYLIWLSEIILQQTRVEQGMSYFLKFKAKYPTIKDLANAPEDEVMKLWEGLGYYSRARNLHFTAKHISQNLGSVFPSDYASILALKGIGPYTAAAIASFAFDLPHAVVDGNVYRVLSRFFGIEDAIDSTIGKKKFSQLAQDLLDKKQAAKYNQAIMDFGATQCTPKQAKCTSCPMSSKCIAFEKKHVDVLPFKEKKIKKRNRYFNYLLLENEDTIYIEKRMDKDIWQNLYQFPLIESNKQIELEELETQEGWTAFFENKDYKIISSSPVFKQVLSHQKIIAVFWKIHIPKNITWKRGDYIQINRKNLSTFAFPRIIDRYLNDNSLLLF